jgi:hypothetical protein
VSSCHHSEHTSTAPVVAAFVGLIVFGLIARYWIWALAIVGGIILFAGLAWLSFYLARRVDKRYAERAALVARADQQNAWVLAGDYRSIYGEYTPTRV